MKAIDYTNSAVNLNNSPNLKERLDYLRSYKNTLQILQSQAESYIPAKAKEAIKVTSERIETLHQEILTLIETEGSYQDLQNGLYAIKQRKVSKSYDPAMFEASFPMFAPAVIIKAVDEKKLQGLIKGGLINEQDLKTLGVTTEKESFAYIIKADPLPVEPKTEATK